MNFTCMGASSLRSIHVHCSFLQIDGHKVARVAGVVVVVVDVLSKILSVFLFSLVFAVGLHLWSIFSCFLFTNNMVQSFPFLF